MPDDAATSPVSEPDRVDALLSKGEFVIRPVDGKAMREWLARDARRNGT